MNASDELRAGVTFTVRINFLGVIIFRARVKFPELGSRRASHFILTGSSSRWNWYF